MSRLLSADFSPLRAAGCCLVLLCTIWSSGCDEDTIVSAPDIGVIQPLATGNTWIYKGIIYDSLGVPAEAFGDTLKIGQPVDVAGVRWFETSRLGMLYRNGPDGFYNLQDVKEEPLLWLPYPAKIGKPYPLYSGASLVTTVLSKDTVIIVPAGAYHCYHYRYYRSPAFLSEHTDYFAAPNVGLIRAIDYVSVANSPHAATVPHFQSDLVSVTLK